MRYVLTADEVRAAERAVNAGGVDNIYLRFNAALAVADALGERAKSGGVAFFCGPGGNGADGLIAAARLKSTGANVRAYLTVEAENSAAVKDAVAHAINSGVAVKPCAEYDGDAAVAVDAIYGIGLNKPITGVTAEVIEKLNKSKNVFRLALDIPSGLDADTGEIHGTAFRAHLTLTFSCYKRGMLFGSGRDVCGRIAVADVGIPTRSKLCVYENADFKPYKRSDGAHKGTSGRVYCIGGCGTMIGAPIMAGAAAQAAYLNGAGVVTVCVPSIHRVALSARTVTATMRFLPDDADGFIKFDKAALDGIIKDAAAIVIGMGMGGAPELRKILAYLCANFGGALVIDADALNALAGDLSPIRGGKAGIVLTPHVGEFRRLTGKPETIENAVSLAAELDCVVVLKSATTVVTDGKETRINVVGTPAMAKGGSGDILGGCIAALACSYSPIDAATIACYRNGVGAERAVSSYAEMMLKPEDILKMANYPEL